MLKKLFKRTRDVFRQNIKPLENISAEDWEKITDQEIEASQFKKTSLYSIFESDLKEAEEIILFNRIHEVREVRTVTDMFQKIFTIPKKEQTDELVGQIKYLREYLKEVQIRIDRKAELEKLEAEGKIVIERERK